MARYLLVASLPAVLLFLLQRTPLHLTEQRADIAVLVAVAWFALSLIVKLDPEFRNKTQAIKEVQEAIGFGKIS